MSNKDVAVSAVGTQSVLGGAIEANSLNNMVSNHNRKPSYLIELVNYPPYTYFISIDKPVEINGFTQAKGIFSSEDAEEIFKNYLKILTDAPKDLYCEVWIPWHQTKMIKSLTYRAK